MPQIEESYGIVSVEPVDAPRGADGTDWHCYTIEQGKNNIRGYRRGSMRAVTREVEEIVFRLNERQRGKFGRVHLTMSSERKKAKRR